MQRDLFRTLRLPWNRHRIVGPKVPCRPKYVWAIRQELKRRGKIGDLALFNCGIDSKLRSCDGLRVSDVAPVALSRQGVIH